MSKPKIAIFLLSCSFVHGELLKLFRKEHKNINQAPTTSSYAFFCYSARITDKNNIQYERRINEWPEWNKHLKNVHMKTSVQHHQMRQIAFCWYFSEYKNTLARRGRSVSYPSLAIMFQAPSCCELSIWFYISRHMFRSFAVFSSSVVSIRFQIHIFRLGCWRNVEEKEAGDTRSDEWEWRKKRIIRSAPGVEKKVPFEMTLRKILIVFYQICQMPQ